MPKKNQAKNHFFERLERQIPSGMQTPEWKIPQEAYEGPVL